MDILFLKFVHGGNGQDLVEKSLTLAGAGVQRCESQLLAVEIVVQVIQFDLEGRWVSVTFIRISTFPSICRLNDSQGNWGPVL